MIQNPGSFKVPVEELSRSVKDNFLDCVVYHVVNVLIEGTTYLDMFDPNEYYLFSENELPEFFAAWKVEDQNFESFPAPHETGKRFCTLVARRPEV